MGLFDKLIKNSLSDDIELAHNLFRSLGVGYSFTPSEQRKIDKITKSCSSRQDVLNEVIRLCGEPNTPRQRYLLAKAYSWSTAAYRSKAIYYIKLYLNNPLYEDDYIQLTPWMSSGHKVSPKNHHLTYMYSDLGKAYEGEYDFENAYPAYYKCLELTPYYEFIYCRIAGILVKQNRLVDAKKFLKDAMKSKYYSPSRYKNVLGNLVVDDSFKTVIDSQFIEIQDKIDRGYIYRPRKKKSNLST